ncbi:MAG: pyrroline-5-carboxylate reductase [Halanaerobiaceae bacterium]
MKLTIIGLGKMGSALLSGILKKGLFQPEDVTACDIVLEEKESNENYHGIRTTDDNVEGVKSADIIILAVKPQFMSEVTTQIKDSIGDKLIISIAAGLSIDNLKKQLLETARIVRVMPNTPALVNEGISAVSFNSNINQKDKDIVFEIFDSVGQTVEVKEKLMDAVTGLSGSGPAYIYMVIEALSDGGVMMGLPRDIATKLAAQTVLGSAKMVLETGKHPGELKDMVTSPGGTTIRAVEALEKGGLRSNMISAVKASAERSEELNNV